MDTLHRVDPSLFRTGRLRIAMVVALTVALVVSCTNSSDQPLDERTSDTRPSESPDPEPEPEPGDDTGSLDWSKCTDELPAAAGLQCATLEVPVDPAEPDGPTTEIALARSKATGDESERIGSLLFNPGGPGGSGVEFLANIGFVLPEELGERFDLVAWDPRGVASSSPVRCLDDEIKDEQTSGDLSPDTAEEFARSVADQAELREACASNNPELIDHMSTADVAADLDRIREALGDEKLSYVGFSYGTAIGATYATLYPDRVRALVLDGSVSPSADGTTVSIEQAKGFESTYQRFIAACDADPQCALSGGAAAKVQAARDRLDATPLAVETSSGTREMGMDLFDIGLATALYDTSVWGITADAIANLDDGGAAVLLALADAQLGREPDGTWDNSVDSRTMVNCLDDETRPSVEEAEAIGQQIAAETPTFGDAFVTSGLACVEWPLPANPVPDLTGAGAPPILVIGTLGDPATPYQWAQQMAEALQSGVLVTYEGDGHTAFTRSGTCIDEIVVRYLVDLEVPPEGTSCPADEQATSFEGVTAMLVEQFEDAGIPAEFAQCIVDSLIAEMGESQLAVAVLQQELTEETVTKASMKCVQGD